MRPLLAPIVNLNGTSKQELLKQQVDVLAALNTLQTALRAAYPHGRDYQTSRTAFADIDARKAWQERMEMIEALRAEIEENAFRVSQQRAPFERDQGELPYASAYEERTYEK